jgi:hypothetical protein
MFVLYLKSIYQGQMYVHFTKKKNMDFYAKYIKQLFICLFVFCFVAFKKNEFSHLFNMFREIIAKKLKI